MVIAKIFGYLKVKTAARCSANDPRAGENSRREYQTDVVLNEFGL